MPRRFALITLGVALSLAFVCCVGFDADTVVIIQPDAQSADGTTATADSTSVVEAAATEAKAPEVEAGPSDAAVRPDADAGCLPGTHACPGAGCVPNTSPATCGTSSCTACPAPLYGTATCDGTTCGFTCIAGYHACGTVCVVNSSTEQCGPTCTRCPNPANGTPTCDGTCGVSCTYTPCAGGCCAANQVCNAGTTCCVDLGQPSGCADGLCDTCCSSCSCQGACRTKNSPNCQAVGSPCGT